MQKKVISRILFSIITLIISACTTLNTFEFDSSTKGINSRFVPANSNVIPLGTVKAQASTDSLNGLIALDAIKSAITQKSDADLLVNYTITTDMAITTGYTNFLWFSVTHDPIYKTTITVEGTAAKMELGRQELY